MFVYFQYINLHIAYICMRTVYHGVHIIITRDAAPFQSLRMSVPLVDGFKPDKYVVQRGNQEPIQE